MLRRPFATETDRTFDSIIVEFFAYLAAYYGALEFLNRYSTMRRFRVWLGFEDVQLATLALWLAAMSKLAGLLIGPL